MNRVPALLRRYPYAIALALSGVLAVANVIALPHAQLSYWPGLVSNLLPLALVAIAGTPSIIGGGIDLSIGPQAVFTSILIVVVLVPNGLSDPWVLLPIVLAIGTALGAINGVLVAVLRFPAIIATLCTMFILIGVNQRLAPQPASGTVPWIDALTGRWGLFPIGLLVLAVPFALWMLLGRTSFLRNLRSAGGDPVAAYSAGVPVARTLLFAYALGGFFAAIAGVALTSLVRSADPTQATTLVLVSLAAIALGGTSFSGGRGGLLGSLIGAVAILLIQNLLTSLTLPSLWTNLAYGALLVGAVLLSAGIQPKKKARVAA